MNSPKIPVLGEETGSLGGKGLEGLALHFLVSPDVVAMPGLPEREGAHAVIPPSPILARILYFPRMMECGSHAPLPASFVPSLGQTAYSSG